MVNTINSHHKNFNIAIIGYGNISRIHHDILAKNTDDFTLLAISDLKPKSKFKHLVNGHIDFYHDYQMMLGVAEIDAVCINTPPNSHYKIVKDALLSGKHVLVEKPPTLSLAQCKELIKISKEVNKVFFMAFHSRYSPPVLIARNILRDKKVRRLKIRYAENVLNYHDPSGWIFNPEIAGGGILMDSGINALSIVEQVLPGLTLHPVKVKMQKSKGFDVETKIKVDFIIEDSGKGTLDMDWQYNGREIRSIFISTDNADYEIDIVQNLLKENGVLIEGEVDKKKLVFDMNREYMGVYEDFLKHLSKGISLTSLNEIAFIEASYKMAL